MASNLFRHLSKFSGVSEPKPVSRGFLEDPGKRGQEKGAADICPKTGKIAQIQLGRDYLQKKTPQNLKNTNFRTSFFLKVVRLCFWCAGLRVAPAGGQHLEGGPLCPSPFFPSPPLLGGPTFKKSLQPRYLSPDRGIQTLPAQSQHSLNTLGMGSPLVKENPGGGVLPIFLK